MPPDHENRIYYQTYERGLLKYILPDYIIISSPVCISINHITL